jgi:hypothetical protein
MPQKAKQPHEDRGGDISDLLYKYCQDHNLNFNQLGKKMNIYHEGLGQIIHRDKPGGIHLIIAMHTKLGIDGNELLEACKKTFNK